jgi:N-dimethylarginine dimethylaminohydrolase
VKHQTSYSQRNYLMCPPTYFTVEYVINPWMSLDDPVDPELAMKQWRDLKAIYEQLGHTVHEITPEPGLPDMVFAANSGTVVNGKVLGAKFRAPQRAAEAEHFRRWFVEHGYVDVTMPQFVNEAEGDFVWTTKYLLAGTGFRTDPGAHAEAQETLGVPVISLQLINPKFYHLDTALFALDERTIVYYPDAFSPGSQEVLRKLYPEAIVATYEDAQAFALNAISDGEHVVLPTEATALGERLSLLGYRTIYVDISEFLKSGGGPKCCTLELRDPA